MLRKNITEGKTYSPDEVWLEKISIQRLILSWLIESSSIEYTVEALPIYVNKFAWIFIRWNVQKSVIR